MTERGRKRVVYTLFAGAVGLGLLTRPWEGPRSYVGSAPVLPEPPIAKANVASPVPGIADTLLDTPVTWRPVTGWPRDPFRGGDGLGEETAPNGVPLIEPSEPSLTLQGVMTVDGQRVCVINGQMERVGAIIEGWRIQRIDESHVRLVRGTEALELHLP